MATSMQSCVRSIRREASRIGVLSGLDCIPAQLQQNLSSMSHAALDDQAQGTSPHSSAPVAPWRPLQYHLLRCNASLTPRHGKLGFLTTSQSFAVRVNPSGCRFFLSDSSVSSSTSTIEALGDVDELNSTLGLAHEYCSQAQLTSTLRQIEEIQSRLLDIVSAVSVPLSNPFSNSTKKVPRVKFNAATVDVLETWMAKMGEEVPHQTGFILPSGGLPAASLHLARSICRRSERKMITLVEAQVVDESVVRYLNRLSDYLFTAARFAALKLEKPETSWRINQRR